MNRKNARAWRVLNAALCLGLMSCAATASHDVDAGATVTALTEQLGLAPVEIGGLEEGGVALHAAGGKTGRLLFQNPAKIG